MSKRNRNFNEFYPECSVPKLRRLTNDGDDHCERYGFGTAVRIPISFVARTRSRIPWTCLLVANMQTDSGCLLRTTTEHDMNIPFEFDVSFNTYLRVKCWSQKTDDEQSEMGKKASKRRSINKSALMCRVLHIIIIIIFILIEQRRTLFWRVLLYEQVLHTRLQPLDFSLSSEHTPKMHSAYIIHLLLNFYRLQLPRTFHEWNDLIFLFFLFFRRTRCESLGFV